MNSPIFSHWIYHSMGAHTYFQTHPIAYPVISYKKLHTTTTMQTNDICPRLFSDYRNRASDWSMIPWCTMYFVYTKYNPEYMHVFTYVCGCVIYQNWRHHHWKTKTTKYIQLTSPKLWGLHFFAVLFAQIGTYTVLLQPGSQWKPEMTCSPVILME